MDKRSYLDTLNQGRQRRAQTSLDELSRTLESLESRFDQAHRSAKEPAQPPARSPLPGAERISRALPDRDRLARPHWRAPWAAIDPIEPRRREEAGGEIGHIAGELKALRAELRHQMSAGLKREFQSLRQEMAHAPTSPDPELSRELERLSSAIQSLSEHSDDRSMQLLRLELEEMKTLLGRLAREESIQSVDRRWDDFDRRWTAFEERVAGGTPSTGGFDALAERLEKISDAVNSLPEALSLKSLDDKVRTLAGAMDKFSRGQKSGTTAGFAALEERLDEITRAIAASAAYVQPAAFDPEPLQRIEARLALLGRQFEDMAMAREGGDVADRLTLLSDRIDDIAARSELPEQAFDSLADQMAIIAAKFASQPAAFDQHSVMEGIDERFSLFSDTLAQRLQETEEASKGESERLMETIEARMAALALRMETAAPPALDDSAVRVIETRLDDISERLEQTNADMHTIDADVIRSLEAQIAGLTAHLSKPGIGASTLGDLHPRLDKIEQSIADNRDTVLEAARLAAESAVLSFSGSKSDQETVSALASDLKSLENLARRSDDRNARTFEAIHDTLLKIVDRLGTIETTERPAGKLEVDNPPSIDAGRSFGMLDVEAAPPPERAPARSPAEAAAAAAFAALSADGETPQAPAQRKKSLLGGIARAFGGSKTPKAEPALAGDPAEVAVLEAEEPGLDEPLDPTLVNRPLEPGSGAPDLNAIMKRVRSERGETTHPPSKEAAKSDFIAAARRAAQAAAAEAEILKKGEGGKLPKSGFKFGNLGKAKRKPILMAAGAIMIALAGLQLGQAFFGGGNDAAEVKPSPLVSQAPVEAPSNEHEAERPVRDAADSPIQPVEPKSADVTGKISTEPPVEKTEQPMPAESSATPAAEPAIQPVAQAALDPQRQPAGPGGALALSDIPVEAGPVALREAAASSDPKAVFEIGARYDEGRGVKENKEEAAKWYEKSAELGFAPAQYRIGNYNEKGTGVARDLQKAKTWYQLAASQGNASAMHNLAVLFAMGPDGAPDNESAGRWFLEAAELGVKDSQFNMGILAAKGAGVPQSLEESYKWFALVAKEGDKDAAEKRDEVANAMRPEQLEKARATTELWKAKPVKPEANIVEIPDSWTESPGQTASIDMTQAVKNIQMILNKNGYEAGSADGVMGEKTKTAIAKFQSENDMEPTGEVDEKLVRALLARK